MTSIDTILKAIDNGSAANVLTEAHDRALFARHHEALKAIETRARKSAAEPIPTLPFSLHRLFEDTGDRKLFEAPYFARRRALADYEVCLLAGLDADGSIAAALGDLLWAICDEYSWALPAHQTLRRPRPIIIDLFAAETGMYLAEALHLVGDQIDKHISDFAGFLRFNSVKRSLGKIGDFFLRVGTKEKNVIRIGDIDFIDKIVNRFLFGVGQLAFVKSGSLLLNRRGGLLDAFGNSRLHFRYGSTGSQRKLRHGSGF